jgi:GT2 family glycosyltransferase
MGERVVGIVVPNFNGWPLLEECLAALTSAPLPGYRLDIVVVDNASTDGSREKLARACPGARLIANAENRGFTPAINQGVAATGGDWVLLLNNDVALPVPALARLLAVATGGPPELGGVQPLLVQAGDPGRIDSAGIGVRRRFRTHDILMGQPVERAPNAVTPIWGVCRLCARRRAFRRAAVSTTLLRGADDVDLPSRALARLRFPARAGRPRASSSPVERRAQTVRKLLWVRRNGL